MTKIDKVENNEELIKTLTETRMTILKYSDVVRPEIHLVAAEKHFGIQELRSRVGIAFELDNYKMIK